MNDTDAFLASLNASSDVTNDTTANDELEVPTMTDAEVNLLVAFSLLSNEPDAHLTLTPTARRFLCCINERDRSNVSRSAS